MSKQFLTRALLVVGCIVLLFIFARLHIEGPGILLVVLAITLGARMLFKSGLQPNPHGDNRDFALKPVARPLLKAVILIASGLAWGTLVWLAYRLKLLQGAGRMEWAVLGLPVLVLLAIGLVRLKSALTQIQYGAKR